MGTGQDTILGTDSVRDALKIKVNDDMTELFAIKSEVEAARDGEASLLAKEQAQDDSIAALAAGSGVLISNNDTTVGYLNGKLVVGSLAGLTLTEQNDGGNETLAIDINEAYLKSRFLL